MSLVEIFRLSFLDSAPVGIRWIASSCKHFSYGVESTSLHWMACWKNPRTFFFDQLGIADLLWPWKFSNNYLSVVYPLTRSLYLNNLHSILAKFSRMWTEPSITIVAYFNLKASDFTVSSGITIHCQYTQFGFLFS